MHDYYVTASIRLIPELFSMKVLFFAYYLDMKDEQKPMIKVSFSVAFMCHFLLAGSYIFI